jgi:hypothetical protein
LFVRGSLICPLVLIDWNSHLARFIAFHPLCQCQGNITSETLCPRPLRSHNYNFTTDMLLLPLRLHELLQQMQHHEIVVDNAVRPLISVTETMHLDIPPLATYKSKLQGPIRLRKRKMARPKPQQQCRWEACSSPVKDSNNSTSNTNKLKLYPRDSDENSSLNNNIALTSSWVCTNTAPLKMPVRRYSSDDDEFENELPLCVDDDRVTVSSLSLTPPHPNKTMHCNNHKTSLRDVMRKPQRLRSFEFEKQAQPPPAAPRPDTVAILNEALSLMHL